MLNQESGSAEFGPGDPIDSCDSELENNELVVLTSSYIKLASSSVDLLFLYSIFSTPARMRIQINSFRPWIMSALE